MTVTGMVVSSVDFFNGGKMAALVVTVLIGVVLFFGAVAFLGWITEERK